MKPYVICHMCTTIDGRILGDRWPKLPGGKDSAGLFESTSGRVGIAVALDKIRRVLGIRRLMLEGGGTFNGEVLHAGLVDEISQVVVPVVDGGRRVTTMFDIPGDPPRKAAAALRLKSYRRLPGGVSWFRYRVARRSGR